MGEMVKVEVREWDDVRDKEFNLLSYQRAVQEWVEAVPEEYRDSAVIEYTGGSDWEGDSWVTRTISYYRPETEQERAEKEMNRKKSEEWRRQKELAEYERLKAKYGSR